MQSSAERSKLEISLLTSLANERQQQLTACRCRVRSECAHERRRRRRCIVSNSLLVPSSKNSFQQNWSLSESPVFCASVHAGSGVARDSKIFTGIGNHWPVSLNDQTKISCHECLRDNPAGLYVTSKYLLASVGCVPAQREHCKLLQLVASFVPRRILEALQDLGDGAGNTSESRTSLLVCPEGAGKGYFCIVAQRKVHL